MELHPQCRYNPAVWIIEQEGNALSSWRFPESWDKGVAEQGPMTSKAPAAASPHSSPVTPPPAAAGSQAITPSVFAPEPYDPTAC